MLQYVQQLQLNTEYPAAVQKTDGVKNHFLRFSGKAQNNMDDHWNTRLMKAFHSPGETGKGISSADKQGCFLVYGLEAQLHPDKFSGKILLQGKEQLHNPGAQAVGTGGDGDTGDIRFCESLAENRSQIFRWAVGIRIRLKISDITAACSFSLQELFAGFQLPQPG